MVEWLQTWTGLNPEEARLVWTLLGIVAAAFTILGTGTSLLTYRLGKLRTWRDVHHNIDRGSAIEADLVFKPRTDGKIEFSVVTVQGVLPLHAIFQDVRLEAIARRTIANNHSHECWLFPAEGSEHHRAYERVAAHVSGNERVANQSALFGRHNECNEELTAIALVRAIAEDGRKMAHLIKIDPRELERIESDETYLETLFPLRGVHVPYRGVAVEMAHAFKRAKTIFAEVGAKRGDVSEEEWRRLEREAGEKAQVWLVPIRTHKVAPSEVEIRRIVREELASFAGLSAKPA
jgi:hypothetical protein